MVVIDHRNLLFGIRLPLQSDPFLDAAHKPLGLVFQGSLLSHSNPSQFVNPGYGVDR